MRTRPARILALLVVIGTGHGQAALAQNGGALEFDGADDRVTVPYNPSFPTEVFSISAWIKAPPPGHRSAIIARGEDDNSFDLSWHHVAATRTLSGELVMYIDGQAVADCVQTGVPSPDNFQDLTIGCTHGFIGPPPGGVEPPIWFFPGRIDEPAMWNIAMTASQIDDVYSAGVDPQSPGLVGLWRFDDGSGQVVGITDFLALLAAWGPCP